MEQLGITVFDVAVIAVAIFGALIGMSSGFAHAVLFIASWVAAGWLAWRYAKVIQPEVEQLVGSTELAYRAVTDSRWFRAASNLCTINWSVPWLAVVRKAPAAHTASPRPSSSTRPVSSPSPSRRPSFPMWRARSQVGPKSVPSRS